MQVRSIITMPAHDVEKVTHLMCDLCHKPSENDYSWLIDSQDISTVEISSFTSVKGDDDLITETTTECDICPDCFKSVIVPFLISKGVTVRSEITTHE